MLAEVLLELRLLRAEVAALRLHVEGKPRRDTLLCELASKLGLGGPTCASASAISLILAGIRRPPAGAELVVAALTGTRLSDRQILRILKAGVEAGAADKSRALCQSWRPLQDEGTETDEDQENAH